MKYGISNLPVPPGVDGLGVRIYGDIPVVPAGATKKNAIFKQMLETTSFLFPPKIPNAAQFSTRLGQYVTRPLNNETTPRQALDEFTQRVQQELDAARAAKKR